MSSPATDRPVSKILDLEVKDARILFSPIWESLVEEIPRENLRFPKEIILLGGAPGAGKGTHTAFISRTRGLTCTPIVMSALLDTPEMKRVKDAGNMIGDREVLAVLLRQLLKPEYRDALRIVDVEEGKLKDLAQQSGITAENAAVRIHRARAALRRRIEQACGTCAVHGCVDCSCGSAGR